MVLLSPYPPPPVADGAICRLPKYGRRWGILAAAPALSTALAAAVATTANTRMRRMLFRGFELVLDDEQAYDVRVINMEAIRESAA